MSSERLDAAALELSEAFGLVLRRLRSIGSPDGLSLTEAAVLTRLDKEGPATAADLARLHGMKPQSMGTTIAALQKRGLVVSRPHPTDGRRLNLELTTKGASLRKSTKDVKRAWLADALGRLEAQERATLLEAARILKRLGES